MTSALVGRVAEVVALDRLRAAAAAGSGAAALVVGEAGIGKTAVVASRWPTSPACPRWRYCSSDRSSRSRSART
jgi:DNA transposition AAA+ family ATPase